MSQTRQNKIVTITNDEVYDLAQHQARMADSANVVIPVATTAERDALVKTVGMSVTSADLPGIIWVWDGTAWNRGIQHVEFTGSIAVAASTDWGPGTLTLDATKTKNQGSITSPAADKISLPGGGLYSITARLKLSVPTTGVTYAILMDDAGVEEYVSVDFLSGAAAGTLVLPNFYAPTTQNVRIRFRTGTAASPTLTTRVRVSRIG